MVQVESEAIDEIGYDSERSAMFVRFAHGGWYSYFAVPKRVYEAFVAAESHGRYFPHPRPLPVSQRKIAPNGNWRRRRDSNPRYGNSPYGGLANRWFQPLTHVSGNGLKQEERAI
jgi:KTSC domain-containing protein